MKRRSRISQVFLLATTFVVLDASSVMAQAVLTRGPYLQMPGPDQMTVVWHTDTNPAPPAIVNYGDTLALGSSVSATTTADVMGGFKHVAVLSLAAADTKYFYQLGDQAATLNSAGDDHSFTSSPRAGDSSTDPNLDLR